MRMVSTAGLGLAIVIGIGAPLAVADDSATGERDAQGPQILARRADGAGGQADYNRRVQPRPDAFRI